MRQEIVQFGGIIDFGNGRDDLIIWADCKEDSLVEEKLVNLVKSYKKQGVKWSKKRSGGQGRGRNRTLYEIIVKAGVNFYDVLLDLDPTRCKLPFAWAIIFEGKDHTRLVGGLEACLTFISKMPERPWL